MSYYDKIPACCKVCHWFKRDWNDWTNKMAYYCKLNLNFPIKKQSCKRQKITGGIDEYECTQCGEVGTSETMLRDGQHIFCSSGCWTRCVGVL